MNTTIELAKQKIAKIKDTATERSYYPLLCAFFEEYAKVSGLRLRDPHATPEETSTQYEHRIGFPDITIRNGNDLIGWVEVKTPQENLNAEKFQEQFSKYKESLENIIFTNLREWQLWQWVKKEEKSDPEPIKTAEVFFDLTIINGADSKGFEELLFKFFEGRAYQTRTPKQLALALAKKTRLLSQQVEEALGKSEADSDLRKLKETFERTLIQDTSEHQFANMVAETMAYSLFLAALEHSRRDGAELTLTNAIDYLPTNVPILADLYSLIKKVSSTIPTIYEATRLLVDQLNASEIERIHQKLVEHKPGEDPVIQFYEPFLKEYDPKEREVRGVYYTPKPVVDYIVKSVDWLLRNKFNKTKGLADESVHLLDPATGTGTFLMSAIQEIHGNIKKENGSLGDEMVAREFNRVVLSHILKHFYGFELLIAPYAIAHLKLTLEVERLGFDFANTKDDADKDNDRFKVYLANTLDDPNKPPAKLFGFDSIPQESESAREVKKNVPILAIVGNPPYSGISQNPSERIIFEKGRKKTVKTWIGDLIEDYKYTEGDRRTGKHFKERKNWLGDDYVKFIRFSQWKIEQLGGGIVGMITNNGFLDNPTFRGMRYQLLREFDEIYCLNLHGSSNETCPDGSKDENVFNIQTGVGITFFVKTNSRNDSHEDNKLKGQVFYANLHGLQIEKFDTLLNTNFIDTKWEKVEAEKPYYFFMKKNFQGQEEYLKWRKINEVFPENVTGVVTMGDEFIVTNDKAELKNRLNKFLQYEIIEPQLKSEFNLGKNYSKWILGNKSSISIEDSKFIEICYRPFDSRWTYFDNKLIWRWREKVMRNFIVGENLGLITARSNKNERKDHFFVTNLISEAKTGESSTQSMSFPLYIYPEIGQTNLLGKMERKVNLNADFIKELSSKLELEFVSEGKGDLEKSFGSEAVFYYAYAIFHSPSYRSRYAEQLKIDFPRLPLTGDKKLFAQLVRFGNELVNLHLLGENPFDESKTIFDEQEKWGVKIDGAKPENLIDWRVADVRYNEKDKRVYVNKGQYFEGVEKEVWEFMIGGYQVCEKWLKDRKKAERALSTDDLKHYMKIVVALRETIRVMKEIDKVIPSWPMK